MEPTTAPEQASLPADEQRPPDQSRETVRPWERVKPSKQDRQSRETFRPTAPSPQQQIIARHDRELSEETDTTDPTSERIGTSDAVICF